MKIATIANGTTTLVNKQLETSVQKLFIDATMASVLPVTTMTEIKAALAVLFPLTCVITLSHQGSNKGTPIRKIPVVSLAEMSTNNGGFIRLDSDGINLRARFTVELSNSGAHSLDDNASLMLDIAGKVSAQTFDIYALDVPNQATDFLAYTERALEAGVPKDIQTNGFSNLALPADTLDSIELHYKNGRIVELSNEEVKQLLAESEDVIISANGKSYYGYMNFSILSVEHCWKARVTLTAAATIYQVKVQQS